MANPFDIFSNTETKHKIAALQGAEVTLKTLSIAENAEVEAIVYNKGFDDSGKPIISIEDINKGKIARVSKALVKPQMSIKELEALSFTSMEAINEIIDILTPKEDEGK